MSGGELITDFRRRNVHFRNNLDNGRFAQYPCRIEELQDRTSTKLHSQPR